MNVVITGGSSGLGAALAAELSRRGHAVGLIARRADALEAVAAPIRSGGGRVAFAAACVTDRVALGEAVAAIEAEHGPTDVAVANAGVGQPNASTRLDLARLEETFRINVNGVANLADAVLPAMIARRSGQLAAVSSLAGWRALPGHGPYAASKAAVSALLEAWRIELAPYGIAVTTLHPGFVRTPMTEKDKNPKPFLLEPDDAARRMADGLLARRRRVDFPLPLAALMGVVTRLPDFAFDALATRVVPVPKPRPPGQA